MSELAYGKRRLLEIAIALAGRPRVLLLDEPMAGVPAERLARDPRHARGAARRTSRVLLIEHDMDLVFRFARASRCWSNGALLAEGPADEIARDPR